MKIANFNNKKNQEKMMKITTIKSNLIILSFYFLLPMTINAAFEFDISYWRVSSFDASFHETISEADERSGIGGFSSAGIETGRPIWELEGDASKYLFELSYRFEDSLHRLKAGIQYAGTGNSDVKEVSWSKQYSDFNQLITDTHFSAKKFNYTNLYAAYRLLPFVSDTYSSNIVAERGLDLLMTWTKMEINYSVSPMEGGSRTIPAAFKTDTKSIGFGVGGQRLSKNELFSISGRIVYLPFFDFPGNGWDSELKFTYQFSEYLSFYLGGKWFSLDVETKETIQNIAQVPGFSDSEATYKGLEVNMNGYTIGAKYKF